MVEFGHNPDAQKQRHVDVSRVVIRESDRLVPVRRAEGKKMVQAKALLERPAQYPPRLPVVPGTTWQTLDHSKYHPEDFTAPSVLEDRKTPGQRPVWADPEDPREREGYPQFKSYEGTIQLDTDGRPLNPMGPTGVRGRGELGKWGANFAADGVITRVSKDGKMQILLIQRLSGHWAMPAGMVDAGEKSIETVQRELHEETGVELDFAQAKAVYQGGVDDRRNTDNAWMETDAFHLHIPSDVDFEFHPQEGETLAVKWADVTEKELNGLYANHADFVIRAMQDWQEQTGFVVGKDGRVGKREKLPRVREWGRSLIPGRNRQVENDTEVVSDLQQLQVDLVTQARTALAEKTFDARNERMAAVVGRVASELAARSIKDQGSQKQLDDVFYYAAVRAGEAFSPAFTADGSKIDSAESSYKAGMKAAGGIALEYVPNALDAANIKGVDSQKVIGDVTFDQVVTVAAEQLGISLPEEFSSMTSDSFKSLLHRITPADDYFASEIDQLPFSEASQQSLSEPEVKTLDIAVRLANATWMQGQVHRAAWGETDRIDPTKRWSFNPYDLLKQELYTGTAATEGSQAGLVRVAFEIWKDVVELKKAAKQK